MIQDIELNLRLQNTIHYSGSYYETIKSMAQQN